MTPLQNPGFTLEVLLLMKEQLSNVEAELHSIETSMIQDWTKYYRLKQARACYMEYVLL
jgi:hypothetical protein